MTRIDSAINRVHVVIDAPTPPTIEKGLKNAIRNFILDETCPYTWGYGERPTIEDCDYGYLNPMDGCRECWEEEVTE